MIKVLVVEDSPVVREFLINILSADPAIAVIGTASNGLEAIELCKRKQPDVITMDIHMPQLDGLEATRKIMETYPTPIVIVSGTQDMNELDTSFRAMEAGALAVLPRPRGIGHPDYEATARELVQTVKLMSEVKVVRRWPRNGKVPATPASSKPEVAGAAVPIQVVAMGASTGGPVVLQTILSLLPASFMTPILIVQHIAPGFVQGFVEWLAQSTGRSVHQAADQEYLLPGHIYVAPDGVHMGVRVGNRIVLSEGGLEHGLRPAVSYLFRSVAEVFGAASVGVLLTGMGKDGARELQLMQEKGAVTFAQDRESSIVHGMPGEAIRLCAARYVLPPDKIAAALARLVQERRSPDERKDQA